MAINWSDVNNWTAVMQTANTNTGGWFWVLINFGVFFLALLIISLWGFEVALLASSFIGLVFALILAYAGLIAWAWVLVFLGLILIMILYIVWTLDKT